LKKYLLTFATFEELIQTKFEQKICATNFKANLYAFATLSINFPSFFQPTTKDYINILFMMTNDHDQDNKQ